MRFNTLRVLSFNRDETNILAVTNPINVIERIITIQNVGRFSLYTLKSSSKWNGQLRKLTTIYAPNGSGKTTLSTIFQSVSGNDSKLILARKSNLKTSNQLIEFKVAGESNVIKFEDKAWTQRIKNIEVFNTHFIEEYLFAGSFLRKNHKTNLFKFLLGEAGAVHKSACKKCITRLLQFKEKYREAPPKKLPAAEKDKFERYAKAKQDANEAIENYKVFSNQIFKKYIEQTNYYLKRFNPNIKLLSFDHDDSSLFELFRIFMTFEVHGTRVQFNGVDLSKKIASAKFSLSEGDKSSIAISFFLAHLDNIHVKDKIIIFDDPISSFDSARKNTTLNILAKFANECEQFFLLTHDLYFAKDFLDKMSFVDVLTLKITNNGLTSSLAHHELTTEVMTSLQKDLLTINEYLQLGADNDIQRREVIRCIRPVLEGILKTKFFTVISQDQWLGDIINLIRNSKPENRLSRLQPLLSDIILLNDYSKSFHHANSTAAHENIDPFELKTHIQILMQTIELI